MIKWGIFREVRGLDFRRRQGWLRVWVLLSLGWVIYASWHVPPPWDQQEILIAHREFYEGEASTEFVADALARADDVCSRSTIEMAEYDIDREYWLAYRAPFDLRFRQLEHERFLARASGQIPQVVEVPSNGVRIRCMSKIAFWENIKSTGAYLFGPPAIVPLLLITLYFLVSKTAGWLAVGFGYPGVKGGGGMSVASRRPSSAEEGQASASFTDLEPQRERVSSEMLGAFNRRIGWSAFAATLLDQFARSLASGGQSRGLNVLLFFVAAIAVHLCAKRFATPQGEAGKVGLIWFALYWLIALGIMTLTVGRFG